MLFIIFLVLPQVSFQRDGNRSAQMQFFTPQVQQSNSLHHPPQTLDIRIIPKVLQIHRRDLPLLSPPWMQLGGLRRCVVTVRDRSKNRKPLQKGRNLSIEAIQAVQALKRAKRDKNLLHQAFDSKFSRMLKFDMVAVLKELIRQNECHLALKVFEVIRKEYGYTPRILLYNDFITILASNQMFGEAELIFSTLEKERDLQPDVEGFNTLLKTLVNFNLTSSAMACFRLMRALKCELDKLSVKVLVNHLYSKGETDHADIIRQEAQEIFWSLEFLEEEEELNVT